MGTKTTFVGNFTYPIYSNAYTVGEQFPQVPLSVPSQPAIENFVFWCISDNLFDIMIMDG